jgi:hypothetical protein
MHVNIIMKYTERSLRDIFNYNTLITLHEKPNRMLSETKCMQGIQNKTQETTTGIPCQ